MEKVASQKVWKKDEIEQEDRERKKRVVRRVESQREGEMSIGVLMELLLHK